MSKGTETRVCGYGEGKGAYSIATKWSLYMKLECPFLLGKEFNLNKQKAFKQKQSVCVRQTRGRCKIINSKAIATPLVENYIEDGQ